MDKISSYTVTLRFANDATDTRTVLAVTYDEAYQIAVDASSLEVVGAVVADTVIPENYSIYGLGA